MRKSSKKINELLREGNYKKVVTLLNDELKSEPDNHWLLTTLSSALYESRKYDEALKYARAAQSIMPECPAVLWDLAGVLFVKDEFEDAIQYWERIISEGKKVKKFGDCWESKSWALKIVNDSRFRLAEVFLLQEKKRRAKELIEEYLKHRHQGAKSIYSLWEAKKILKQAISSNSVNSLEK